jgi:hypothetical protein
VPFFDISSMEIIKTLKFTSKVSFPKLTKYYDICAVLHQVTEWMTSGIEYTVTSDEGHFHMVTVTVT